MREIEYKSDFGKKISEMRSRKQDRNQDELKALVQDLISKQAETDKEVKALRQHIDNGWRNEFISLVVNQILEMFKATGTQMFQLNTQREKLKGKTLIEVLKIVGTVIATVIGIYFVQ
ncbi:MAG TPA: hypothetical protein PK466_11235 [Thermotogota bacterium]|nr:hypothetical protein [Thermotogota bacterium]HPR96900.1 hypothetical protein [Thermotogota bacterium]